MSTEHTVDTIDITDDVPREVAAEVAADLARIGVLHRESEHFHHAAHIAEIMAAAARALGHDGRAVVGALAAYDALEHTCGTHLVAAIQLLAEEYRGRGLTAVHVVQDIPDAMQRILSA